MMLLLAQVYAGCSTTDENLPAARRVKVIPFPVQALQFREVLCTQEYEKLTLSGSVKNVSLAPVTKMQIRAEVFYAGQPRSERFSLPVQPPLLQPNESGTFELNGEVSQPISLVELHAYWKSALEP
jgi:hypothetical protein